MMDDANELPGKPLSSIELNTYGLRPMERAICSRLMVYSELDEQSVKLIKKIATDVAEEALKVSADLVFNHRMNGLDGLCRIEGDRLISVR